MVGEVEADQVNEILIQAEKNSLYFFLSKRLLEVFCQKSGGLGFDYFCTKGE
ncbi:hypothetical protein N035_014310 [Klebsiella pneumoniae EGD-HP19-C]|nr:hypothetical protein N035_014310 [Klebsiella pneumoniae EGD-HP19-C]